jgi:hypothetical protein
MLAVLLFCGLLLALTGCGGGSSDSSSAGSESIANTTDVLPTNDATTTEAESSIGQGVDQTCDDLVGFFALAKETDIAHGGNSVADVEKLAAAASELASKAPAEPSGTGSFLEGEPRESLTRTGDAYTAYVTLLSDKNLEPGPDALLDPDIAQRVDLALELGFILQWIDARCSDDVKSQLEELASG